VNGHTGLYPNAEQKREIATARLAEKIKKLAQDRRHGETGGAHHERHPSTHTAENDVINARR
jgi:hypothetical protein